MSRNHQKTVLKHLWEPNIELAEDFRHSPAGKTSYNLRSQTIERVFGCSEDNLRDFLGRKVTKNNYKEFGRFDELLNSVDLQKAERFFRANEQQNYKQYRLKMYINNYLKEFVLSGGMDQYSNIPSEDHPNPKQAENPSDEDTTDTVVIKVDDSEPAEIYIKTTVDKKKLRQWHSSSKALACMMETGCFAYVEQKICFDDPKYIERQEDAGKMRLTAYAKDHEEECFLQFVEDDKGNLHYLKLPASVADKEFRYSDYIDEDILTKYGLVNEMAKQMLEAIHEMEFGPALKELMSKRICNYSVNLLRSTTGLDNNTISKMWGGQSLTKVNVVSACLGIHIPFPVSSAMLELANIIFRMDKPPETNMTYIQLLTLRWASDYDDIYEDLKAEGMNELIKQPPQPMTKK